MTVTVSPMSRHLTLQQWVFSSMEASACTCSASSRAYGNGAPDRNGMSAVASCSKRRIDTSPW